MPTAGLPTRVVSPWSRHSHLGPVPFTHHPTRPLFGAIGDSTPDRWGRVLMRRAERRRAETQNETPRTLREIDYLLMVDDESRQVALRFAEQEGGSFLAQQGLTKIPPLVEQVTPFG